MSSVYRRILKHSVTLLYEFWSCEKCITNGRYHSKWAWQTKLKIVNEYIKVQYIFSAKRKGVEPTQTKILAEGWTLFFVSMEEPAYCKSLYLYWEPRVVGRQWPATDIAISAPPRTELLLGSCATEKKSTINITAIVLRCSLLLGDSVLGTVEGLASVLLVLKLRIVRTARNELNARHDKASLTHVTEPATWRNLSPN